MGQHFLEPHEITDKATILRCLSLPGLVYDYPEVIATHQFLQVLLKLLPTKSGDSLFKTIYQNYHTHPEHFVPGLQKQVHMNHSRVCPFFQNAETSTSSRKETTFLLMLHQPWSKLMVLNI